MKKYILTESQIRNLVNNVVDEGKKGETKYSPEYLEKIKEKYKGKLLKDFENGEDKEIYNYVSKKDYYQDFTKDMIRSGKCPDYSESELRDIAKIYETKTEFKQKNRCAHKAAIKLGPFITNPNGDIKNTYEFLNSVTSHMSFLNNLSKRLVYAFEFYDESNIPTGVYVGLTYNVEQRIAHHETGINFLGKETKSVVNNFKKENPTYTYKFKELTDYIDANEAAKLERYWEKAYFLKGWNILNIKATGGLGKMGKSLKQLKQELDYVYDVEGIKTLYDLQNSQKYKKLYGMVFDWGLHDPRKDGYLLGKFERQIDYIKTNDELMDDVKKYNSYGDFKKDKKLYSKVKVRKLLNNIKDYFDIPYTFEHLKNLALEFNNYTDFYNSLTDDVKNYLRTQHNITPKIKELFSQNEPIE
jgi:hypothetical protein